jgi:hypothetical protein
MLTDFADDLLRLNDRGHRVWAEAFWTDLKRSPPLTTGLDPAAGGQRSKVGLQLHS